MKPTNTRIAIIGAGMAGLSCANALAAKGFAPTIFDKGRGPGGRMAARRAEVAEDTLQFDHGAQHFSANSPAFARQIAEWEERGIVAAWPAAGEGAFVGTPAMNAPIRALAEGLDVRWGARIETLEYMAAETGGEWTLKTADESFTFDSVICAVPAEQAAELLAAVAPQFAAKARAVTSTPCWAAMVAFEAPLDAPDCVRGGENQPIAWAARNSAKPGRLGTETWVIHGSADFSRSILEHNKEDAAIALLNAFAAQARLALPEPIHAVAHRWLYAFPQPVEAPQSLWDEEFGIGVCGDWLSAARVEDAFLSGKALAQRILG